MPKFAFRQTFLFGVLMMLTTMGAATVFSLPGGQSIFIRADQYKPQPVSAKSSRGKELFEREKCATCHSIRASGGCLAPPLDGEGAHRNRAFILARITDSQAEIDKFNRIYPGGELLQHPRLKPAEAEQITSFLLTIPEPVRGYQVQRHAGLMAGSKKLGNAKGACDNQQNIELGRAAFISHGCVSCHSINGLGGRFAPALDGEGTHRNRAFVEQRITDAQFFTQNGSDEYNGRGLVMPPTDLTSKDISQITDFIMSLPPLPEARGADREDR